MRFTSLVALNEGLAEVRGSPSEVGSVELIACRPAVETRELLDQAELDPGVGLIGDCWLSRGSSSTADSSANPDAQLTLMNARVAALVAGPRDRWALAGDQLYVDLDLSTANLPPGTRLGIGDAVIEVTALPHTGCGKFVRRFGVDAQRFVNSAAGRELNLRGLNTRIVAGGTVRIGDAIRKLSI